MVRARSICRPLSHIYGKPRTYFVVPSMLPISRPTFSLSCSLKEYRKSTPRSISRPSQIPAAIWSSPSSLRITASKFLRAIIGMMSGNAHQTWDARSTMRSVRLSAPTPIAWTASLAMLSGLTRTVSLTNCWLTS